MPAHVKSRHTGQPRSTRRGGPFDGPHKRRKRIRRKKVRRNLSLKHFALIVLVAFFLVLFFYVKYKSEFWNGEDKLSLVVNKGDGTVLISVFDPQVEEIINVTIPAETQVRVARQLGTLKIKNVWQLGLNENLNGELLAETVTRHFKFPVVNWADSPAEGFASSNLLSLARATFTTYKTNLTIADKIRVTLFAMGVERARRSATNLADTPYIKKATLADGGEGYLVSGITPQNLLVIFSDSKISKLGTTVSIKDATSDTRLAGMVGEVIEAYGAKVVSIDSEKTRPIDCFVSGKDRQIVDKFARLFSCEVENKTFTANFEVEILIGEEFAKRY